MHTEKVVKFIIEGGTIISQLLLSGPVRYGLVRSGWARRGYYYNHVLR